jgi:ubiquinone/menaquinone biosynthesis C-methylase UbiE
MPVTKSTGRRRPLVALRRRASEALAAGPAILSSPFVSAKLLPLQHRGREPVLTRPVPSPLHDGLPVPPTELWERWGHSAEQYLESGRSDVNIMLGLLEEAGAATDEFQRVLDFGCAEGRMLRFFPQGRESELWGVDINAGRISWAQTHLPDPFRFAVVTTAPHLPFEDNRFDLVYCLSVFTHISDLADAWFLEILRILRPGGHVYLTIHDEHSVDLLLGSYGDRKPHAYMVDVLRQFQAETGTLSREWIYFTILADPAAQVFYRANFLVEKWSKLADWLATKPEAADYQTALVFRKRQ